MYRRRQQRTQSKQVEEIKQVEEVKKVEKKEEPVIKAVVKPQKKSNYDNYKAPMVNILRAKNYFGTLGDDNHYVPFGTMVDTVFSKGFLYVEQSDKYGIKPNGSENIDWHESFVNTTNYERNTFMCGDIIYTHDAKRSIAFLITKVYEGTGEGEDNTVKSELQMYPPVGPKEEDNTEDGQILSSFVTCTGTVYMFKQETKFSDIKEYASKYTSGNKNDEYRKLYPTNLSAYSGTNNSDTNGTFTSKRGEGENETQIPDGYPKVEDLPTETQEAKFMLTTGVVVEGWLIYMTSSKEGEEINPDNITGDIIRTGKIVITKVGDYLNLGGVLKFPYVKEESASSTSNFYYNGNDTKFASEPLNSEHYQLNYNDTTGTRYFTVTMSCIQSLKGIMEYLGGQNNDGDNDGN